MSAGDEHRGDTGTFGRGLGRSLVRAVCLRCPECGSREVLASWFVLRSRCPGCRRRLDRGEHDHFLGAMLLNLVAAELSAAGLLAAWILASWPDTAWGLVTAGGVLAAAGLPVLGYPFSRLVWLAVDLRLRPGDDR